MLHKIGLFIACVAALLLFSNSAAMAGCPVSAERDAQHALKTEGKLKALLAAAGGEGEEQVILEKSGDTTTIAPGSGLEKPRQWSAQEKQAFDKARVNTSLPAPKGVWK